MKRCPKCNYPNPESMEICFKCGASLEIPEPEPAPVAEPQNPVPPDDDPSVAVDAASTSKRAKPALPGPLKVAVNSLHIGAVLLTFIAVTMLVGVSVAYTTPQYASATNAEELLNGTTGAIASFFVAAIASIVVCYGLTNLKPWSTIAGLIVCGAFVASAVWLMVLMSASGHFGELTQGFLVMSIFILVGVLGLCGLFSEKTKEAFKAQKVQR